MLTNLTVTLQDLALSGGLYRCPRDSQRKRIGPLVDYAGTYLDDQGQPKHYVGDTFYNLGRADQSPSLLADWATIMTTYLESSRDLPAVDLFLGMPMGGLAFTFALGHMSNASSRVGFLEKKVTQVATADAREQSMLVLGRHEIPMNYSVVLVEDVVNNFSTTAKAIEIVESCGANVIAIACMMNRSARAFYVSQARAKIPVVSIMTIRTEQYRQDYPSVKDDIEAGNVVWKPKDDWGRLMGLSDSV